MDENHASFHCSTEIVLDESLNETWHFTIGTQLEMVFILPETTKFEKTQTRHAKFLSFG